MNVKTDTYSTTKFANAFIFKAVESPVKEAVAKGVIPHHLAESGNADQFVKAEAVNLNLEVPVDCACCVVHIA